MIDVYYPYIEGKSVWDELRYSLRSVEQHLKIPHRIVIVGDKPKWLTNVLHIKVDAITTGAECCLRDTLNKLNTYLYFSEAAPLFIRMYDDVYFINDVDMNTFSKVRGMYTYKEMPDRHSVWFEQLRRTFKALKYEGYNTETHFPELFVNRLMQNIFEDFKPVENQLLVSTLYFNSHYDNINIIPQNKYAGDGAKFYGANAENIFNYGPCDDVEKACKGKLFLNHNDEGLTDAVKAFLIKKFPNKSQYEN